MFGKKQKKQEMVDSIHNQEGMQDRMDTTGEIRYDEVTDQGIFYSGNGTAPGKSRAGRDSRAESERPESTSSVRMSDQGQDRSADLAEEENFSASFSKEHPVAYEDFAYTGSSGPEILEEDPEEAAAWERARELRRKKRKRERRRTRLAAAAIILVLLLAAGGVGYIVVIKKNGSLSSGSMSETIASAAGKIKNALPFFSEKGQVEEIRVEEEPAADTEGSKEQAADLQDSAAEAASSNADPDAASSADTSADSAETSKELAGESSESAADPAADSSILSQAELMAAQYDYDGAIALLKAEADYESNEIYQTAVAGYEQTRDACVAIDPTTVSHVFVHCLIVDPARAFDGDSNESGYNLNMVTVDEFNKIIQQMYDNDWVLVSLHDMGEIDADGNMQPKTIYLPEGKKPVIFSQDDISYYHTYKNDGFADRLVVDENGDVKNEYTDADGNTTVGNYDMVPILNAFVEEHPDFSYHGRKGIICLTGYNGVLGYRTDGDYKLQENLQENQRAWLDANPDFDFDAEVAAAAEVATAMKEEGWEFASHTWGHISVSDCSLDALKSDTEKWETWVEPIVGDTDMIIFAFGSDIGDWTGYADDNEKFQYLKSMGYDYFCNVDGSTLSWVQFGSTYLRTGRMDIDGYRMAENPDRLTPLFDVSTVYDYENRPSMDEWHQ